VLAARDRRPRFGLVCKEARDALALERGHHPLVYFFLAGQQFVGERDFDGHALSVAAGCGG
jgi:hypothetical protein